MLEAPPNRVCNTICLAVQVRCKTGVPQNNGRPIQISDLKYYRPYEIPDDAGRGWPGDHAAVLYLYCSAHTVAQHTWPTVSGSVRSSL